MRKMLLVFLLPPLFFAGCKKEKQFVEPEYVFAKWARASETLNYQDYASCEAYPKSEGVFREMFRDTFFADMMVTEIGKPLEKTDPRGNGDGRYIMRNVQFECAEIRRRDRKPVRLLRGDVDFIKILEGDRAKRGWLMWNRKIVRIER